MNLSIKDLCQLKTAGYSAEEVIQLQDSGLINVPEPAPAPVVEPAPAPAPEPVVEAPADPDPLETENERLRAELAEIQKVNRESPVDMPSDEDAMSDLIEMFR